MEARLTLRSKTATKAEKEAAEVDLARALGEADPDETPAPGAPTDPAPRAAGPAKTTDRVAGSTPVQQRGAGRGR